MKSDPECLICMLRQALNTVRVVTQDRNLQQKVLKRVAQEVQGTDLSKNPALISTPVYQIVSEMTGAADPYKASKVETNQEALKMLPELQALVDRANDPLKTALHVAVTGNIIDLGIGQDYDLKRDVKEILNKRFAIDHIESFKRELQQGRTLLYLGDNAGEIVFDRVLIEEIMKVGVDVTFSVKSSPVINDALMEDAVYAGLTDIVRVIETGSGDIGVNLDRSSEEFRHAFESADVIIGKGHGNFETCTGLPYNLYFLLKAKCDVVASELGVQKGDIVFKHIPG